LETQLSSSVKNGYVLARGLAYGLALVFALYYSKLLGIENRSLVTLIFTNTIICLTIFTSGIGLLFRSRALDSIRPVPFRPFFLLVLISAFLTSIAVIILVLLYSQFRYSIHPILIVISGIYSFSLVLDDLFHQTLIAYRKFKVAAILDVSTIIVQIFIFTLLFKLTDFSPAVVLFISILTSYLGSVSISYWTIQKLPIVHMGQSKLTLKDLIKESKAFHLVGISSGIADRIDRLLIGWLLPLSFLGAYAVGTSLLTYLRFIPEAIGRLIVASQDFGHLKRLRGVPFKRFTLTILILMSVPLAIFMSQSVVVVLLGKSWEVSSWIIAAFAVQEILRGLYTFVISRRVKSNEQKIISRLSLMLIIGSLFGGYIGIKLFGGIGVPIFIGLTYGLLSVYSWLSNGKNLRR
jgi:O-antigen/teichoic acid export membrane protein